MDLYPKAMALDDWSAVRQYFSTIWEKLRAFSGTIKNNLSQINSWWIYHELVYPYFQHPEKCTQKWSNVNDHAPKKLSSIKITLAHIRLKRKL